MKTTKFGVFLLVLGTFAPLCALAAPALDSVPDAVKSKYQFVGGEIKALVTDGTTLYVGGNFTEVLAIDPPPGDPPIPLRANLAAIDLTTYELVDGFNPQPNYGVESLALSSDGSTLYVGGVFSCFGAWDDGEEICSGDERFYLAAVNTADGTVLPVFSPEPDAVVSALVLNSDDSVLYAGGDFFVGDAEYAAAYTTADNTATVFDAGLDDAVNNIVLSSDDATLYVVGNFLTVNDGVPQERLAAFDSTTGGVLDFNASIDESGLGPTANVLALSSDDATLYVGGFFDLFERLAGEGMVFNETTEEPVAVFPKVSTVGGGAPDTIYAAIPDGDGGWYIGGSFTNVGTTTQGSLAHITAAGVFDGAFNPTFTGAATIYTLELSPDGSLLYAGGSFLSGDEQYAAAFNTADGSVAAFSPFPGGTVYDIELSADGETLYLGGSFATVNPAFTFRFNAAAFDTTGAGTLLPFDPQMCDQVKTLELTGDGSTLYMGGDFTCVNSETTADTRNRIAAFSTAGAGTLVAGFDPNANGTVEDLLLAPGETTIYAGGAFTTIGGASRNQFAEITLADGTATALDAGIAGTPETVYTVALSSDESTIYIGGDSELTTIGGQPRRYFGEINATTGAVTDFYPAFNGDVHVVAASGGEVFVGGSFTGFAGADVLNLIAVDTSDSSLISTFVPEPDNIIRALSLSSDDALLYAGGDFLDVNSGTTRNYLAAFNTTDGTATAFDPTGEVLYGYATALKGDDTELYFGSYDADDTGNSELLVFDAGDVIIGDDDDEPPAEGDDDDGGDGGGSSGRRVTDYDQSRPIILILTRLISVLQELIALTITQQSAQ